MAIALRHQGNEKQARATLYESIALARKANDPDVLYECLIKAWYVVTRAYESDTRLALIEEAVRLAPRTEREENVLCSLSAYLFPLIQCGHLDDARQTLNELERKADAARHVFWSQLAAGVRVKLALIEGRWKQALEFAQESVAQGSFKGLFGAQGRFGFQMFAIHRATGTLQNVAPVLAKIAAHNGDARVWLPGRIALHYELNQKQEAVAALEQLGDLSTLPYDDLFDTALVYLAETCVWLNDRKRCRQIYTMMKPYRGSFLSVEGIVCHGAATAYLAMLASALRRNAEAKILFDEVLQVYAELKTRPFQARTQTDYAEFLLRSDLPADRTQASQLLYEARATADALSMRKLIERIDSLMTEGESHEGLSHREIEVLTLIAAGTSNKRVAEKLHISPATVATHVRNILRKTATRNRTEAVNFARRSALIPPD